jgi:hypothetical protein
MRAEGSSLSVFFKERDIFDRINDLYGEHIVEFYEPADDIVLKKMLEYDRLLVRDSLIHGCRYKIMLREGKTNLSVKLRENIVRLISDESRFFNTKTLINDFKNHKTYVWSTYIYAKESKDLLMFQMLAQPIIRETVKIVTTEELRQEEKQNAE